MSNNLITFVGRVLDGMILVATQDYSPDIESYKDAAKKLIKNLKPNSPNRCTIEIHSYYFHYTLDSTVIYLTLCERGYPRKLAFSYLEQLQAEFTKQYSIDEILRFSRPYAAINFDPTLAKIRRTYLDPNTPNNVKKLNSELLEIHNIMSANINEVLQRGEKLDLIQERSSTLLQESKKFEKYAKYINLQQLYKTWAPIIGVLLFFIAIIYWRFIR